MVVLVFGVLGLLYSAGCVWCKEAPDPNPPVQAYVFSEEHCIIASGVCVCVCVRLSSRGECTVNVPGGSDALPHTHKLSASCV